VKKIVSLLLIAGLVGGFALTLGLSRAQDTAKTEDKEETSSSASAEESAIPVMLQDSAFERFVDVRLLGRAIGDLDAALLTDVALQLAEGERVLLRSHKGLPAKGVLQAAVKMAAKKGDKTSLGRLAKYAKKSKDDDLGKLVNTNLKMAEKSRPAAPAMISGDTTPEQLSVYKGFLAQIDSATFLGDAKGLAAVAEEVGKLEKGSLPDKLKADLIKRVKVATDEVKSSAASDTQKALSLLSEASRASWAIYKKRGHRGHWQWHGRYRSHHEAERDARHLRRGGWFVRIDHH